MSQNENKQAPRDDKGFEKGKKSYTQNPNIDEMAEKPERWEKEQSSKTAPERNEVDSANANTPRK